MKTSVAHQGIILVLTSVKSPLSQALLESFHLTSSILLWYFWTNQLRVLDFDNRCTPLCYICSVIPVCVYELYSSKQSDSECNLWGYSFFPLSQYFLSQRK